MQHRLWPGRCVVRFRKMSSKDGLAPRITLVPTFVVIMVFFYGFILWTLWLSLTNSRMLPRYEIVGIGQYISLFLDQPRWITAMRNLLVFTSLFTALCIVIGLILAILLDQKVRASRLLQTVYLYPMALSFIVTGTIWKWILNPSLGIERLVRSLGFSDFTFRWLVDSNLAIYMIVLAAVWQSSGYIVCLFLAGLRSHDTSILQAAQVDGASLPVIYWNILIPALRPVILSSLVILVHLSIKTFDLVMVLTQGGPGNATDMPSTFMYDFSFRYDRLAMGAASSIVMLVMVMIVVVPYLVSSLRSTRDA